MTQLFNISGSWVEANTEDEARQKLGLVEPPPVMAPPIVDLAVRASEAFPGADVSGLKPLGGRYGTGLMTDRPDEVEAWVRKKHPNYTVKTVESYGSPYVVAHDPKTNEVYFQNFPGVDTGDFVQGLGAATVPAAIGATVAATGGGIVPLMAAGIGSELLREGAQKIEGTSRESLSEYGLRAGISGLGELPGAATATGATMLGNSLLRRGDFSRPVAKGLAAGARAEETGILPEIPWYALQFTQDPVKARMWAQQRQLAPEMRTVLQNQMDQVTDAARGAYQLLPPNTTPTDVVGPAAARFYDEAPFTLPPNSGRGGETLAESLNQGMGTLRRRTNAAYQAERRMAAREQPTFDLDPAAQASRPRPIMGVVEGENGPELIDLAQTRGNTAHLAEQLEQLAAYPQSYDVMQEMYQRTNALLDLPPATLAESGVDIARVQQIKSALVQIKDSPEGGAPGFQAIRRVAEQRATELHKKYDTSAVKAMLQARRTEEYDKFYSAVAESPDILQGPVVEVLRAAGNDAAEQARFSILRRVISGNDPIGKLNSLRRDATDGYNWLVRDTGLEDVIRTAAKTRTQLNTSAFKKAADTAQFRQDYTLGLLREQATDVRSSRELVRNLGGAGTEAQTGLRQAVMEDIIGPAIQQNKMYGVEGLNPDSIIDGIRRAKDSGWWDGILAPRDRTALEGLQEYAKRSWVEGDPGNALTAAGLVRKLFSFDGHEAVVEIGMSRWFAKAMISQGPIFGRFNRDALQKASRRAAGGLARPALSGKWLKTFSTVASNIVAELPVEEVEN